MRRTCEGCGRPAAGSLCRQCAAARARRKYLRRGPNWPAVRAAILERDGHRCRRCGRPCPHPRHHDVNHIEPLARSPDRRADPGNLETLCHACHVAAGGEQHTTP